MTTFAIAGIQLETRAGDNMDAMGRQIEDTMNQFPWVQMILFGELCALGTDISKAQVFPGPAEKHFCGLAMKHRIWLLPGSMYEIRDGNIFNTAPVINPEGDVVARHRKIYPWPPYEKNIEHGNQHTVFEIDGVGHFGVSVCYDMWFPETTRALACMGAEVILHSSMTRTIDRDLEHAICRATGGINQCYFIDINNAGRLGNGSSIVVGPEGDIIYKAGQGGEIIPFVVDLERVRRTRKTGMFGVRQPLKRFQESRIDYPQYQRKSAAAPTEKTS